MRPRFLSPIVQFASRPRIEARPTLRASSATAAVLLLAWLMSAFAHASAGTPVGTPSNPLPVTITLPSGGSINSISVYTGGVLNQDFSLADAGNCTTSVPFTAGQSCTLHVTFTPKYPGQRQGAVVLRDAGNAVLGSGSISETGSGSLGVFTPGVITTVAGNSSWLYRGDGGPATASSIFLPYGVAVDAVGNLFIADSSNNRIRRVDVSTGNISTYAGNGNSGPFGDGGPATSASLSTPTSITLDAAGNVYFADSGNNAIRRVDSTTGIISTVAGTLGTSGNFGDGGLATHARLNSPNGIALDGMGKLYVADTANNAVRVVDLNAGTIALFAGSYVQNYSGDGGPAITAMLNSPWGVTVAPTGELYIADQYNHCIRKVALDLTISTVVGNHNQGSTGDGGPAMAAELNEPASIAIDAAGNLYIADSGNNAVRKVSSTTGFITTAVGNGLESFSGDGGPADQAGLYGPYTLALDGPGNLYIADLFHNRIRMVASNADTLTYPDMRVMRTSAAKTQILENDGNTPLTIASIQAISNATVDPVTTTCAAGQQIAVNATCVLGARFSPLVTGNNVTGSIAIQTDAANTPDTLTLEGNALSLDPPTIALSSSGSPAATRSVVTFSVSVTSAGITPTGTVTFMDGNNTLGTITLNGTGAGTYSTTALIVGTHVITASYSGDSNNAPGTSAPLLQSIRDATMLLLSSNNNPATVRTSVTFTVTISGDSIAPTGSVQLYDTNALVGTASPNSGVATFTFTNLAVGSHRMQATYSGDSHSLPSNSNTVFETINQSQTSTALTSSNNDATVSNSINLVATVTSVSAGTPTGSVTFSEGATALGNIPLDSHGTATLPISTLAVGSHTITAVYNGDTNNATSTSPPLAQTIEQITTTVTLSSSANPANSGTSLHLVATVTPAQTATGVPLTGNVTFFDGSTTLGTATTNSGSAAIDISTLSVARHSLTATYNGAPDYATGTSVPMSQLVQKATTNGTLTASANPVIAGRSFTLSATVNSGGVTPTGNITFQDGANIILGQIALNSQGIATLTVNSLPPGTHGLVASYAGDGNSLTCSPTLSLLVQQATTSTAVSASPNPSVFGTSVLLRATVTGNGGAPSGLVDFHDGATDLGTGQIGANGIATLSVSNLAVGPHTLSAVYQGDPNDAASTSASTAQTVQQTTTSTVLTPTLNPAAQRSAVQIAVRVTSNAGIPGGSVQILDGASPIANVTLNNAGVAVVSISTLTPGSHNLTAIYLGDANDAGSTSPVVVEVIQPTTSVTLGSDHNPANAGAVLTLSAAVSGSAVLPSGTVTFREGNAVLGTAALSSSATAALHISTLAPGTHPLTATYSGDSGNAPSASPVYSQTVQLAATQTTLSLSSTTATVSTSATFTAAVTGNGGIPTGTVTFLDGATPIRTATLGTNGTASVSISTLSLGQHTLSAVYTGDPNDAPSTAATQQLTILKAAPSLSVSSTSNPSLGGATVDLTATLTSGVNTPSGQVTWTDNGAPLGTSQLGANAIATFASANLSVGQHLITAIYPGDASNSAATSPALTQIVQIAASSVALSSNRNPAVVGDSVSYLIHLTGSGGQPGGSITVKDGATTLGTVVVDSSGNAALPVTVFGPGTHTLVATYAGDAFHSGNQSLPLAQAVLQPTSSTLTSSANPSVAGRSLTLTAKVAPANAVMPTGTVTFLDGTSPLGSAPLNGSGIATFSTAALSVGQHAIVAVYSGDSASQTSRSSTLAQTVNDASTTTTLTSVTNPSILGAALTFTAQVTGQGGTPTGSVTFQDGTATLGQATISAAGVATFATSSLQPGQHSIAAIYNGDRNDLASTSAALAQLVEQRSAVVITSGNNPALTADPVNLLITVTNSGVGFPTGTVVVKDGSNVLGTATLAANGTASFTTASLPAGTHSLVASYSGDTQNTNSTSLAYSETIQLRSSTTSLSTSLTSASAGQTVTLIAVVEAVGPAAPTGAVIFTSGSTTLGAANLNSSGVATLNLTPGIGTLNAAAVYQGDGLYATSTSPAASVNITTAAHFTLTTNPATISVQTMQHLTVQLTLASVKSFEDTLSLGCAGLPFAATCTFSKDHVTLQPNGSVTVSVVVDTGTPLTAGGQAQARLRTRPATTALCFLPLGALASFLLFRSRPRRSLGHLLTLLLLAACTITAVGCGSIDIHGTPPGKYTVNFTATGASTGVIVSQPVPLTVTR